MALAAKSLDPKAISCQESEEEEDEEEEPLEELEEDTSSWQRLQEFVKQMTWEEHLHPVTRARKLRPCFIVSPLGSRNCRWFSGLRKPC